MSAILRPRDSEVARRSSMTLLWPAKSLCEKFRRATFVPASIICQREREEEEEENGSRLAPPPVSHHECYSAFMATFFVSLITCFVFGRFTMSTPFSKEASAFSASISTGSGMVRVKEPKERSLR
jgi:hypothetical protein